MDGLCDVLQNFVISTENYLTSYKIPRGRTNGIDLRNSLAPTF